MRSTLQTEGLKTLVRRGVEAYIFRHGNRYVYEHSLQERDEADFLPRIQDYTHRIIASNAEADDLASEMGFDFRSRFSRAQGGLDNGAIAFCIFVEGAFAAIGWAALDERGKSHFEPLPYKVDFPNGQACTGGTWTNPEYRGRGLMAYGVFKRFQFLKEKGFTTTRSVVATSNVAAQKVHAKFGPIIPARARQIKVLWWEHWQEEPYTGPVPYQKRTDGPEPGIHYSDEG